MIGIKMMQNRRKIMELKNKDIAEGMYVTNGKQVWKVLDWNSNIQIVFYRKLIRMETKQIRLQLLKIMNFMEMQKIHRFHG